ncbi:FK506-binding protein-like [Diorhabda sublineata]|uniref:FK506-binding protein-like n=1 Tax=Diorhabda sublineata TaxID=1163346 RepID=UPI0024E0844A|nr:FK506-binding protein-like [Diorhabda sublineata]
MKSVSPDGRIKKEILEKGKWGQKPAENSRCTVTIMDYAPLKNIVSTIIVIGDTDGELWNLIEICLGTMDVGEKSKFFISLPNEDISLIICLEELVFDGYIYKWDAIKKFSLATYHKEKGNDLFKSNRNKEAALRFIKALKILHSIPLDAEELPISIENLQVSNLINLKEILYNNLSSCYFRNSRWLKVIDISQKVLLYNSNNVKALYKLGIAYKNDRNFEKSFEAFSKVLKLEPDNKACTEHMNVVKDELRKADIRVKSMVKKMFSHC